MRNKQIFVFLMLIVFTGAALTGVAFWENTAGAVENEEKHFTILHTNDIHSRVDRFPIMAGKLNEIRAEKEALGEPVLLTDGGDFLSPYIYYWLNSLGCSPELKMMQRVGYDAVTLGNHEFDLGARGLAQLLKNADYPDDDLRPVILGTNTEPPEGHPLAEPDLYRDTFIKELDNGLTVGFFGMHGRGTIGFDLFKSGPVHFPDPYETARQSVKELRDNGADIVILLIHDGFDRNVELAAEVSGIDLIMGGHNHRTFDPAFENDTVIIQTSAYLEHLSILEVAYDPATGRVRLRNEEEGTPYHLPLDDSVKEDEEVADYLTYFDDKLDDAVKELTGGQYTAMDDVVARAGFALTSETFEETTMGNFATDAIRLIAEEKTGEKVDFAMLASGLCWRDIGPGNITFKDLADIPLTGTGPDMLPGHPLVSFYLTGEEVRRILEIFYYISLSDFRGSEEYPQVSGLRVDYNPDRAVVVNIPMEIMDMFVDNTPVPSMRTVVNAERYTGDGPQTMDDEDYVPLERGDEQLYRVVTESYILYHLPTLESVLDILPMLEIVPKDRYGNPVRYMNEEGDFAAEDVVVYDIEGNEVKTWQALVEYAAMQPQGAEGIPDIPFYYAKPMDRINEVWTVPFYVWLIAFLAAIIIIIVFIVRTVKRRKHGEKLKLP